jgi:hypothetical protein
MTVQQKQAWFTLILCAAALVAYALLLPSLGPDRAFGAFGIIGFSGLPALLSRLGAGKVLMDERDQLIGRRAQLVSLRVFWIFFVSTCLISWFVVTQINNRDMVPAYFLFAMLIGAWVLYLACHSVAILVQYRLGHAHEE